MANLGGKPMDDWIEEYGHSHQHPVNRICHTIGIPLIALSLPLFLVLLLQWATNTPAIPAWFWQVPTGMFLVGWIFQFVGHAVEGEAPEFFKDWRFLFVGLRWWFKKVGL
jgi:uncharacterized membrane protein YGL010W